MSYSDQDIGKNELVRHILGCLVYRTTKIIHDAPENYPQTSLEKGARTPEKILSHINSLIQLSNRFWSHKKPISMAKRRKKAGKKGWDREVKLFYEMVDEFDETLKAIPCLGNTHLRRLFKGLFSMHLHMWGS